MKIRRILITGTADNIGGELRNAFVIKHDLILSDCYHSEDRISLKERVF